MVSMLILLCSIIYCIVHIGIIMLKMLVLTIKVTHCKCCFLRSRIPVHHVHLNLNIDILPLPKKALWQTFTMQMRFAATFGEELLVAVTLPHDKCLRKPHLHGKSLRQPCGKPQLHYLNNIIWMNMSVVNI